MHVVAVQRFARVCSLAQQSCLPRPMPGFLAGDKGAALELDARLKVC
jgi:hypothetical protein